jgi:uncharacterized protein YaiI (UPF0178 family)
MSKILVDADSCPVKNIIVQVAKEYSVEVIMFADTSHILSNDGYSKMVTVDKHADSADIILINSASKGDIIITQDYGLASMALTRSCYCINNNGLIYSEDNIDRLMFERHISSKLRRAGKKASYFKKRASTDDENFRNSLISICKNTKKKLQ